MQRKLASYYKNIKRLKIKNYKRRRNRIIWKTQCEIVFYITEMDYK